MCPGDSEASSEVLLLQPNGREEGRVILNPRDVVLNVVAGFTTLRDPLRRARDRKQQPDFEKVVEVALASLETRRKFFGDDRIRGASILEIGSGLSACLAVLFVAMGARRVVNVEIDRFGFMRDEKLYRLLVTRAQEKGIPISWPPAGVRAGGQELIELDPSRITLHSGCSATAIPEPDSSMDLGLSLAVLEHVRGRDMRPVADELIRLMKPGAVSCHRIDMVDHYTRHTEPFRFLKFSELEYQWMYSNRGSSSNRLRIDDFERIFKAAGFANVTFEDVNLFEDEARFHEWEREFHPDYRGRPQPASRAKDCLMVLTR